MKTVEETIGDRSVIDIVLETDVLGLEEVVVTSLGITRTKKALGYSVQDISGAELTTARESNVVNSLQGKLAGVQISNSDGGVSSGVRILIRGMSTLSGNNQPLFVVDGVPIRNDLTSLGAYGGMDYGNSAMDLNPSDIETITVLKGANAAALYGSRAVNGVILVTTKTGKPKLGARKGLGISLESNWMFDNVLVIPDYQNEYGQGSGGLFEYVDGAYGGVQDGVDESWGPKLDGRLLPQFDSPYDPETDVRTPTPWVAHPDNIKDFFETGLKRTTSFAVSGASDNAHFRLSISNQDVKGTMPSTDLRKNTVSINSGLNVTDKLSVAGGVTYVSNKSDNIVENGYNAGNPMQSLSQWFGRQVDTKALKDRWEEIDPLTDYNFSWNHSYHDNPYFVLNKNTNSRNRDRIMGNFNLSLDITDWLNFRAMVGNDWYIEDRKQLTAHRTNGDRLGGFWAGSYRRNEITSNAMLTVNRDFGTDINVVAWVGGEYNHYDYQYHSTSVSDLIIPDLYATSNASVPATTGLSETHTELQSVFGNVNLGFRNYLFVDLTARNDWSSTLPVDENSYFYPSVSLGFVVTEALGVQSDILSYAKVRASYAEVGGTAGAYQLQGVYSAAEPFLGNPSLTYTNTKPPLGLKPQRKKSLEFGTDLKFLNNRIGLDATYYKENTINQIMNIAISRVTGFSTQTINAGNIQNQGVELTLRATPVQNTDFRWDITANWARNRSEVIELYEDMRYLNLYYGGWSAYVHARPGEEYGVLWGYSIVRENAKDVYYDAAETEFSHTEYSGRPLISTSGRYIRSNTRGPIGNVMPDWFGGVHNSLTYKDLNFSFLVDFRKGGDIFSVTNMFGMYAGILEGTADINDKGNNMREDPAAGGGLKLDGVMGHVGADGSIVFTDADGTDVSAPMENTVYVGAERYGHDFYGKHELSTFDASFVKLREVVLGYTFDDVPFLSSIGVGSVNLSLVGRNLWIIHTDMPHIDPENAFSAGTENVGMESNAIPSVRSYGFNFKVVF
jgi:TonB-linked SusC/RagA family outer membrane protein